MGFGPCGQARVALQETVVDALALSTLPHQVAHLLNVLLHSNTHTHTQKVVVGVMMVIDRVTLVLGARMVVKITLNGKMVAKVTVMVGIKMMI